MEKMEKMEKSIEGSIERHLVRPHVKMWRGRIASVVKMNGHSAAH